MAAIVFYYVTWRKSNVEDPKTIDVDLARGMINGIKGLDERLTGIPVPLVLAFIKTESDFRLNAVSSANCKGLMQLKDSTFTWIQTDIAPDFPWTSNNIFNPIDNIAAGMFFIDWLRKRLPEKVAYIQAYNVGYAGYKRGRRARVYLSRILANEMIFLYPGLN